MVTRKKIKKSERGIVVFLSFLILAVLMFYGFVVFGNFGVEPSLAPGDQLTISQEPYAVTTFNSISIYSDYENDANKNSVAKVRYRVKGTSTWKQGHDLYADRYDKTPNPIYPKLVAHSTEFRGSLVELQPQTTYEIEITYSDSDGVVGTNPRIITATTWTEVNNLPIGKKCVIPKGTYNSFPFNFCGASDWESGTSTGYTLYEAESFNEGDVVIKGSQIMKSKHHIIIRGITFQDAPFRGLRMEHSNDVILDRLTFKNWATSISDFSTDYSVQSAVNVIGSSSRIVVQDSVFKDPKPTANTWRGSPCPCSSCGSSDCKPQGPAAIHFEETLGNHVIRYNWIGNTVSGKWYADAIGGDGEGRSGSRGNFYKDTDIYGNYVTDAADDGMEIEGDNINIRIWDNHFTREDDPAAKGNHLAMAPSAIGPVYVWKNIFADGNVNGIKVGGAHKTVNINYNEDRYGPNYVYHNTFYDVSEVSSEVDGDSFYPTTKHAVYRNNLYSTRWGYAHAVIFNEPTNSYNYGLRTSSSFSWFRAAGVVPSGQYSNGVAGSIGLKNPNGKDFTITSSSAGLNKGLRIYGFNDGFTGTAPDIGAYQFGELLRSYGPRAYSPPSSICGNLIIESPETCDDGNLISGDGCSSSCQVESTGGLYVSSIPSGANVSVDGVYKGVTPLNVYYVTSGTKKIEIIKNNSYWEYETNVYVSAGETTYVSRTLSPLPISCTIADLNCDGKVNKSDADVFTSHWNTVITQQQIESIQCLNLKNFLSNYYKPGEVVMIRNLQVVASRVDVC